ncbi:Plant calmodulin-binding domain [Musa troglodytarum]|uniref:Plant calmodulin-binding domain n=1 Tax=Musa troglodytarum TaxID=320322 RepID=A0A9E7FWX6_9LILI|nr:Plant calmodulin-binding domain [Musa troglodytarum]
MDKDSVSVNPIAKDGMKKHSTRAMITRGSSIPSTSKERPLPNYLRASTNSCHDFCKYGWKEPAFETDTKPLSVLRKLNNNLEKHSTGGRNTTVKQQIKEAFNWGKDCYWHITSFNQQGKDSISLSKSFY